MVPGLVEGNNVEECLADEMFHEGIMVFMQEQSSIFSSTKDLSYLLYIPYIINILF